VGFAGSTGVGLFIVRTRGRERSFSGLPFASDGKTVIKERFYLEKDETDVLWDDVTAMDSALTRNRRSSAPTNPGRRNRVRRTTTGSRSAMGIMS
jgi:hypothetical protein